tara:strand:+ start:275 stop:484 length:210 start_codon:yes stop_codon:yes gene_type:complete
VDGTGEEDRTVTGIALVLQPALVQNVIGNPLAMIVRITRRIAEILILAYVEHVQQKKGIHNIPMLNNIL